MNKIVLEGYPVDRLPEDIQRQIVDANSVRLIVETRVDPTHRLQAKLEDIFAARQPPYLSADEIMEEIHKGRYENS